MVPKKQYSKPKTSWATRYKLSNEVRAELEGKVRLRTQLLLTRAYLYNDLDTPLEAITDKELLSLYGIGPKTIAEFRKVIPIPMEANHGS